MLASRCRVLILAPLLVCSRSVGNSTRLDDAPVFTSNPNPFKPNPIVDPTGDITCSSYTCSKNEPCDEYPVRVCTKYSDCKQHICLHKALYPILQQDVLLFLAIFVISFLAGAPGIGGGGINVPVLMILSSFDIKEAVPLSHIAVMGNALSQMIMNTPRRHPLAEHRPLIHYEIAALLLPAMLGGNSLGVVVGRVFPPTMMIIFSLVLLALTATKTVLKGCHLMHELRPARAPDLTVKAANRRASAPVLTLPDRRSSTPAVTPVNRRASAPAIAPAVAPAASRGSSAATTSIGSNDTSRGTASIEDQGPAEEGETTNPPREWPTITQEFERRNSSTGLVRTWSGNVFVQATPRVADAPLLDETADAPVKMRIPWKVISFMVLFNLLFCADFLALSKDVSGIEKCSAPYFVALVGLYPVVAASVFIGVRFLLALAQWHADRGDAPIPGDPAVNGRTVIIYPSLAVLVGLMAGLLGLGGGEFLVPLLLEFGVHSRVASATSGFLIFFNTSSNVVHYMIAGTIEPFIGYGLGLFFVSGLGSLSGLLVGNTKFVQKHSYLIIFLVAFLLVLSAGLLVYRGLLGELDWSFSAFCS